ncbi:hypothetical protein J3Q64DRAFT_1767302 [Phycomyces blakesleeanus]|uniref:Uncharacterized protein n=2 Tax=Phycomyces blakesleeanus TaxID=4837 RepID=A0A167N5C7_PHYB8|nr:hypothetical protein PHYBLDRAFT_67799 [Phycomyces blakesleeanus NRRL 1555(-)]OAD75034.1 hypothetical protein PHYBLDRAFT_67799 [Phycomyces blakesleeanus NRRL 1555(-)]|eukprot:XP_018293074.1 hypothetical protein PHYBLDRAFT_67799 [Phycomyces blakesleeanus NRRL 1555(-)]
MATAESSPDSRRQSAATTSWLKQRPQNTGNPAEKQRTVDRELERIKSLAMVSSVWQKTGPEDIPVGHFVPTPSPSTSASSQNTSLSRTISCPNTNDGQPRVRRNSSLGSLNGPLYSALDKAYRSYGIEPPERVRERRISLQNTKLLTMHPGLVPATVSEGIESEFGNHTPQRVLPNQRESLAGTCELIRSTTHETINVESGSDRVLLRQTLSSIIQQTGSDIAQQTAALEAFWLDSVSASNKEVLHYRQQLAAQDKTMQNTLEQFLAEKEKESHRVRQLTELVLKQDRLIQGLEQSLELQPTLPLQVSPEAWGPAAISESRAELRVLQSEMATMKKTKMSLERAMGALEGEVEMSQGQVRMMMLVSTEIQNDFDAQTRIIQDRVLSLENQLKSKDALIFELSMNNSTKRNVTESTPREMRRRTNSNSTFGSSVISMHPYDQRQTDDDRTVDTSHFSITSSRSQSTKAVHTKRRSSANTLSTSSHISYVARWADINLPPATPPPSEPLPPLPNTEPLARPQRSFSATRPYSPPTPTTTDPKHSSVDTIAPFITQDIDQDEFDIDSVLEPPPVSVTKEIDEVYAWQASTSEHLPGTTKWMDDPESGGRRPPPSRPSSSEKTHSAFWKGMKKKWMVREK